jgi:hypothetical protein
VHRENINPKKVARLRRKERLLASRRGASAAESSARIHSADKRRAVMRLRYDLISEVATDGVQLRAARSFPAPRVTCPEIPSSLPINHLPHHRRR